MLSSSKTGLGERGKVKGNEDEWDVTISPPFCKEYRAAWNQCSFQSSSGNKLISGARFMTSAGSALAEWPSRFPGTEMEWV